MVSASIESRVLIQVLLVLSADLFVGRRYAGELRNDRRYPNYMDDPGTGT